MRMALLLTLVLLGGCAASGVIMMENPKTGMVFRCERNTNPLLGDYHSDETCAQALEQAGWKRL